ncbi:hypothetical protein [Nocardioides sp. URHA0020]|uniref:hypothetical protein n=1 Tax=Nocardioides sp. URHA0020 TaxID=1380392 RepID=UPI0012DEB693|nr:hypothetical protein [Nocardioides sp. URHA0020]
MALDPSAEYERVSEKYASVRASDLVLYMAAAAVLSGVSLVREVSWVFFAGIVAAIIAWESTKFRLRRNARYFADSGR